MIKNNFMKEVIMWYFHYICLASGQHVYKPYPRRQAPIKHRLSAKEINSIVKKAQLNKKRVKQR